jgi:hypothetical protein
MKPLLPFLIVTSLLVGCTESSLEPAACGTAATVRDLTGLDGCGWVFELEDGTKLIPHWQWGFCGTPPLPEGMTEDPLFQYEYVDGKPVFIEYAILTDMSTACMAGPVAKISCIQDRVVDTGE